MFHAAEPGPEIPHNHHDFAQRVGWFLWSSLLSLLREHVCVGGVCLQEAFCIDAMYCSERFTDQKDSIAGVEHEDGYDYNRSYIHGGFRPRWQTHKPAQGVYRVRCMT